MQSRLGFVSHFALLLFVRLPVLLFLRLFSSPKPSSIQALEPFIWLRLKDYQSLSRREIGSVGLLPCFQSGPQFLLCLNLLLSPPQVHPLLP